MKSEKYCLYLSAVDLYSIPKFKKAAPDIKELHYKGIFFKMMLFYKWKSLRMNTCRNYFNYFKAESL